MSIRCRLEIALRADGGRRQRSPARRRACQRARRLDGGARPDRRDRRASARRREVRAGRRRARLAAARGLGWPTIARGDPQSTPRAPAATSVPRTCCADADPVWRRRAVERMLADGYSVDGAATVLGWHKRRVTARQRILELPETAQTLGGTGEIPIAGIDALLDIEAVLTQAGDARRRGDRRRRCTGRPAGRPARARPGLARALGAFTPARRAVRRARSIRARRPRCGSRSRRAPVSTIDGPAGARARRGRRRRLVLGR